jgi:hypothetical protein
VVALSNAVAEDLQTYAAAELANNYVGLIM